MVFYKNIVLNGKNNIPEKGPCIFACTHPNSFLDAIVIGAYSPRKVYFLARSDVFNTKFKHWLLSKLNMIPIYRMQEGAENLHKNEDTFSKCYEILKKGGTILIFSEGISVIDKMVRPLKKGTARIVFGAEEAYDFNLSINVIGVGINYTYPTQFRTEIIIGFNKAIHTINYKKLYQESKANAIKIFNEDLLNSIKNVSIITEDDKRKSINYETIAAIVRSKGIENENRLEKEKKISLLNFNTEEEYLIDNYRSITEQQNERAVEIGHIGLFQYFSMQFIYSIFYMIGFLPNAIPYMISKNITHKKVRQIEFFASVKLCLFVLLYLIYLPIISYVISQITSIHSFYVAILLIGLGMLYVSIKDYKDIVIRAYKIRKSKKLDTIFRKRKELIAIYEQKLI